MENKKDEREKAERELQGEELVNWLLENGYKMNAIRAYMQWKNCTLLEAKDVITNKIKLS